MIPRSDRVFFNVEAIPTSPSKSMTPPSLATDQKTPCEPASMTTSLHWKGGKRNAIVKSKPRVAAPATPWRSRISRKSPPLAVEDQDDQPSPLDRKAANPRLRLKLGTKSEPMVASPAPTSATLVAAADRDDAVEPKLVADAYRRDVQEPGAPRLEQGTEWSSDRWRAMHPTLAAGIGPLDDGQAYMDTLQSGYTAFHPRSGSAVRLNEAAAAYDASARRADACLAFDLNHDTNVYVNGLPKEMTDHMLYLLGSACGVVISHKAMLDRQTNQCKGFGFLMYASAEMAKHAIDWLNSHGFAASFAKESFSAKLRRMADTTSTNVYLSNLPIKFTTQQLEQLFTPFPIASLKILYDIHGESRGVGFVRLFDRASAKACIERLHGRVLPGTTLPLRVRFADSDAQKHLKHSVNQKHTLESLGLLMLDSHGSMAGAGAERKVAMDSMRGEQGAAVAGQHRNMGTSPRPFIPCANSMPSIDGRLPPMGEHSSQSSSGLGIQVPGQVMWSPPCGPPSMPHPAMWPSIALAGVVYSGAEGTYPVDRPYSMPPMVAGVWDASKGQDVERAGYLPIPLLPPPGLGHVTDRNSLGEQPPVKHDDLHHSRQAAEPSHFRARHVRNRNASLRVRFPGNKLESGARAVSDPMALLAAQARVREALGQPDRVRAAVSADNSIDDGHDQAPANTSVSEESSSDEEDEESFSVEIQIHADPRAV